MLARLLRYPFGSTRARALAAGFVGIGVLKSLAAGTPEEMQEFLREHYFRWNRDGSLPLESRLRLEYLAFGRRLAATLPETAAALLRTWTGRLDLENLKTACRGLLQNRPPEDWQRQLLPLSRPEFSLDRLRSLNSFEDLLGSAPRAYRPVLRRSLQWPREMRLLRLELDLDRLFWERVAGQVRKLPLFDRQEAREILGWRADLDRFNLVRRAWRAGLREPEIIAALPPLGELLPRNALRLALRSAAPAERLDLLYRRFVEDPWAPRAEVLFARRLYRRLQRVLRSHPFGVAVPLAALLLKELEVHDLLAALAGLRLKRTAAEVQSLFAVGGG